MNNNPMNTGGSQDEPPLGVRAASGMRDAAARALSEALRAVVLWATLLVVASVAFAALTARPLARITGEYIIAYTISVALHFFLGLSAHMWKLGRARQLHMSSLYGAFTLLLMLGIIVIGILRAQMMLERGVGTAQQLPLAQQLAPYLISLFMALVEIVAPMVAGSKLADSWLNYESKKQDYDYAVDFALRITTECDPMKAWIHEAYTLKRERRIKEVQITQLRREVAYLDAQNQQAKADIHEATIAAHEAQIRLLNHRLTLIERWYPGDPRDLQDESDRMLDEPRPPKDRADGQMPPADTDAPREADKPKQPET